LAERGEADALARGFPIVDAFLARTLIEGLQERADAAHRVANPELAAARERAFDEMVALRIACSRAPPSERAALEGKLEGAESRYEDLEQSLRLANPALAELTNPGAISLASLQREVLGPEDLRVAATTAKDLLLVGDPAYPVEPVPDSALAMRPLASLRPERVRRLEKTRDEVCFIARLLLDADEDELARRLDSLPRSARLGGARFDLLLGAEATKSNLAGSLRGHRGVHLAVARLRRRRVPVVLRSRAQRGGRRAVFVPQPGGDRRVRARC
jgi:hypothetical protein